MRLYIKQGAFHLDQKKTLTYLLLKTKRRHFPLTFYRDLGLSMTDYKFGYKLLSGILMKCKTLLLTM